MKRLLLVLGAFLCLIGIMVAPAAAAETIKVGVVLPLTGEQAKFGEIERNSFLMALEAINKAGGVNGRQIELLIEDDTGKADVGRSAVEKLVSQNKVVVLGGGYSSQVTMAMAQVAQQNQVPFVVNTGSADDITEKNWTYVFRINPPASEYFKGLSSFLSEVAKPQSVAILYENTLFGQSQSKEFKKYCEGLNLKVVVNEGYESGAVDFKPLLVKVKDANPDLIYMVSYVMDASLLMRQARELQLTPKLFVGGGAGFTLPEFIKNAGPSGQHVFSASLWVPEVKFPGAKEYYDQYLAKYKSDTEYHGAEAYACMQVIADALKRAKELTPAGVREALTATGMPTVFGPVKFVAYGKKTQQNSVPTYLVQWIDNKLETVWPKEMATKQYVYPIK